MSIELFLIVLTDSVLVCVFLKFLSSPHPHPGKNAKELLNQSHLSFKKRIFAEITHLL